MPSPDAGGATTSPVDVFASLGDPTRLKLIDTLSDGESRSITQLSEGLPLTRQAVTKHLGILEAAGMVQRNRVGRESHFAFCPKRVEEANRFLLQMSQRWDDALGRLRQFVEE